MHGQRGSAPSSLTEDVGALPLAVDLGRLDDQFDLGDGAPAVRAAVLHRGNSALVRSVETLHFEIPIPLDH